MKINVARSLISIILIAFSINAWCAGMVYKCKNQEGALVYQKSPCENDVDTVDSWTPKETTKPALSGAENEQDKDKPSPVLTVKQNTGGHYAIEGNIDGKSLNFVIDTGASYVSLPESTAHNAQIYIAMKKRS